MPKAVDGHKRVGRYILFDTPITVYLVEGRDSTTEFEWREDGYVRMDVARKDTWAETMGAVLHEVMEVGFVLRHCHFRPFCGLRNEATAGKGGRFPFQYRQKHGV